MKKIILAVVLSMGYLITAQQEGNPFYDEENSAKKVELNEKSEDKDITAKGPGNPDGDDDLPIDDYVPILLLIGLGVIVYHANLKNKSVQLKD